MTETFESFGVPKTLADALAARNITTPTPIQAATLADSIAGKDVLGRGRTGSGKTFAFLLPLVTRLGQLDSLSAPGYPQALVLAPTRELAAQIDESLQVLLHKSDLTSQIIIGGVNQKRQVDAIKRGVDILIACPGRLEDLMNQGLVSLEDVLITVLDEADHMTDLGFLPGVKRILKATDSRGQRLLFSATLDNAINSLVKQFLKDPVVHEADSEQSPVATMTHHVFHINPSEHLDVVKDLAAAPGRKVVFTRTKYRAKKLARQLNAQGVPAVELHGNLSQNARTRTMDAFHSGKATTLVATDIAARGIHVDDVALVLHADPPVEHKAYLHRSGRTARAGSAGTVVTLMTSEQRKDVQQLTRKAGIKPITTKVSVGHPLLQEVVPGERTFPGPIELKTPGPTPPGRNSKNSSKRGSGKGRGSGGSTARGRHGERPGDSMLPSREDGRPTGRPTDSGRSTNDDRRDGQGPRRNGSGRDGASAGDGRRESGGSSRSGRGRGAQRPQSGRGRGEGSHAFDGDSSRSRSGRGNGRSDHYASGGSSSEGRGQGRRAGRGRSNGEESGYGGRNGRGSSHDGERQRNGRQSNSRQGSRSSGREGGPGRGSRDHGGRAGERSSQTRSSGASRSRRGGGRRSATRQY